MREYEFAFQEGFAKGLRPTSRNMRNVQYLVKSQGMFPEDGALRSVDPLSNITGLDTLGESFPYPQVHIGQSHIVVFGATQIWEYEGGGIFTSVLSGLVSGDLWSVADFHNFIVATNGQQMVKRNTEDHTWEVVVSDETLPLSQCVAAVNGQLIVGGPVGD